MASSAFARCWAAAPSTSRAALEDAGADDLVSIARLVRRNEIEAEVLEELFGPRRQVTPEDLQHFADLRGLACRATYKKNEADAQRQDSEFMVKRWKETEEKKRRKEEAFFEGGGVGQGMPVLPPGPARGARKPRSRLRSTGTTAVDDRRAAAKDGELRAGYVGDIVDILIALDCPTAQAAARTSDPRETLSLVAAGRRASTLRARLRSWRAFLRWLWAAHGERWPQDWRRVLDYMRARVVEPCGKQTLLSLAHAAGFWERATGWPLTADPLWDMSVKELLSRVAGRAGGQASITAPPFLMMHLALLEQTVMDEMEDRWLRCYAGWKAIKVWGALRFSDHRGMSPGNIELHDDGITYRFTMTKTTGKEKTVQVRMGAISAGAYLQEKDWLQTWMNLMAMTVTHDRDYLMSPPGKDPHSAALKELTYAEAAGWSRALLLRFGVKLGMTEQAAGWMSHYFTEHSERSTLTTIGMAMGHTEEYLKPLGGWGATSAQRYMKAAVTRMQEIQDEVAHMLRKQWGAGDLVGEAIQIEALARYLQDRGIDKQDAIRQAYLNAATDGKRCETTSAAGTSSSTSTTMEIEGQAAARTTAGEAAPAQKRRQGVKGTAIGLNPAAVEEQHDLKYLSGLPESERGYVVSITAKTRFRRLHFLGACCRIPGIHYMDYELYGSTKPGEYDYHDHCRQCWPPQDGTATTTSTGQGASSTGELGDPEATEDSQDHSSSSEGES